jgi:hypothetical protein
VAADRGSLVQLELAYTRELGPSATPRLDIAAHFVRYRVAEAKADPAALSGLLGFGGDERLPLGACVRDDEAVPSAAAMEISLLDAGPLAVRARDASGAIHGLAELEPQQYPAILPFVSGVVYGLEATPAPEVLPGEHIEIEGQGGEDVGPFVSGASAPDAFPDLRAERDPAAGDVAIAWVAPTVPARDPAGVLVELRWSGSPATALRCRVPDEGRFTVPAAQAVGLDTALAEGASAQVSLARSTRSALSAPGVGAGTLTVTLRDSTALSGKLP